MQGAWQCQAPELPHSFYKSCRCCLDRLSVTSASDVWDLGVPLLLLTLILGAAVYFIRISIR